MVNGLKLFTALEKNGSNAIDLLQKKNFSPNNNKTLRTWGIKDTAEMVGKSRMEIYLLEEKGTFPKPKVNPDNKRKHYTLADINRMRDYFNTRPSKPQGCKGLALGVMNYKGGVGKSENSISLGQYFALKGYKVLCVDLDNQASLTHSYGYIPDRDIDRSQTLFPFMIGEDQNIKNFIRPTYWDGLDLIVANLTLFNSEFKLPVMQYQSALEHKKFTIHNILARGIEQVKNEYDLIIFDSSPSMGIISMNSLYAADALIVPTPPSMLDLSSTIQFFGMARDVFERLPEKQYYFLRVLLSKIDQTDSSEAIAKIIRRVFGDQVLVSTMPLSEAIKKCRAEMKSIYETEKYSGSKSTLDRVKLQADNAFGEIESLVKEAWQSQLQDKKLTEVKSYD